MNFVIVVLHLKLLWLRPEKNIIVGNNLVNVILTVKKHARK